MKEAEIHNKLFVEEISRLNVHCHVHQLL